MTAWNLPPGVTGNEDYFTGAWHCTECDVKQDGNSECHEHPRTGDPYCTPCYERLVEFGKWPDEDLRITSE